MSTDPERRSPSSPFGPAGPGNRAPVPGARASFQRELDRLQDEVLVLGSLVEKAILRSVEALRTRDVGAARAIDAEDLLINRKRFEIEEAAIRLIATQQPMASDLRRLTAMLNIVTDLERMGDYAAGIARICIEVGPEPLVKPLVDIPRMADKSVSMLRRALDTFVTMDAQAAEQIALEDDDVDSLYRRVYRELIQTMLAEPRAIDQATHLLWAAHNLERVADRVQNVCERVVFVATGRMRELSRGPLPS